jgi:DNA-directed RNA polymerase specialized sigma24 family protein
MLKLLDGGAMKHLPHGHDSPRSTEEKGLHATAEDFERLFAEESTDLLRLALHLTANAEEAENCVVLAMRDCFFRSSVTKEQVGTWARRMVMRNAMRLVWGMPNDVLADSGFEFHLQPSHFPLEVLRESVAILTLPSFERLAFVICVLERYSILDGALLLGRAPQEVYDAVVRAINHVIPQSGSRNDVATGFAGEMYGALWAEADRIEGSCGFILDGSPLE